MSASSAPTTNLLLVSGSLRAGSTNAAVLHAAADVAPPEVACVFYHGLADLPHFNPDDDAEGQPVHIAVAAMREAVAAAAGLLF